nr:putative dead-like helicase [Wheat associated vipovirus]
MSEHLQVTPAKGAAGRVSDNLSEFTTIRRVAIASDAASILSRGVDKEKAVEAPLPRECSYKFAASIEELKYVARRVVKDDVRAMELQAPPGVGKSTKFPGYLRELTTDAIVVLEPTEVLARAQVNTVSGAGQRALLLSEGRERDFRFSSADGVVYTTPRSFLLYLRLMQLRTRECSDDRVKLIVLHDECHENDASTYALRQLWSSFPQIHRYVKMSATTAGNSAESRQRHNSAHKLKVCKYPPVEECDVSLADTFRDGSPCPWSAAVIPGGRTLMFIEDDATARHLYSLYAKIVPARILRRNDPYEAYEKVSRDLTRIPNMVVLVDSGYQTGYTFDAEVVIDFGVRRQSVDDGGPVLASEYRLVTESERRQRMERVGRFKAGTAYVPDEPAKNVESILGPGEVGLAAAWYVLLGFKVPESLMGADTDALYTADIPALLGSGMPWGLWRRVAFSKVRGTRTPKATARVEPEQVTSVEPVKRAVVAAALPAPPQVAVESKAHVPKAISGGETAILPSRLDSAEHDIRLLLRDLCVSVVDPMIGDIPSVYVADLISDSYNLQRWFDREVLSASKATMMQTSSVDSIMHWSVWVAAWNTNVTAEIVHRQGQKIAPATPGLRAMNEMHGGMLCSDMRKLLLTVYTRLMIYDPKRLETADGRYYIDRCVRMYTYHLRTPSWAGGTLHKPDASLRLIASQGVTATRDVHRNRCATVSSGVTDPAPPKRSKEWFMNY